MNKTEFVCYFYYTTMILNASCALTINKLNNNIKKDEALREAGPDVQRMVMGHTPQHKINSALGGKAWRIDVGASKGVMGGTPEVLEIVHMGGENDEDIVNILTVDGERIEGTKRAVPDEVVMDFFDLRR